MSEIENQKISIKGIFRRGDKFLVLYEANKWWELPGGKLELGESLDECFAREIGEELGWQNVKISKFVHAFVHHSKLYKTQYVILCVAAEPSEEEIKLSDEHEEYRWLTIDEIEKLDVFGDFLAAIKKSMGVDPEQSRKED